MTDVILFGGTTEGRKIAKALTKNAIKSIVLVASDYGEALLEQEKLQKVLVDRLNHAQMKMLIDEERPRLVIDATHPYAREVSANIQYACKDTGVLCLRVLRESTAFDGLHTFDNIKQMICWLKDQDGIIFSTLGAKEAKNLTTLKNYQDRVFLRVLPCMESLSSCLALGFESNKIICMQGPFDEKLNEAMFRTTKAKILLTKESGSVGGFEAKVSAAKRCGMEIAVWKRPKEQQGISLDELLQRIEERRL